MDWWSTNTSDNYLKVEMCFENYFTGIKVGPFLVQGQNKTVGGYLKYKFTSFDLRDAGEEFLAVMAGTKSVSCSND